MGTESPARKFDGTVAMGAAMSIVAQAKAFAEAKHAGKVRKYTDTPYSEHLAAVVALLEEHRIIMPNVLASAWLHDTVEDTDTTIVEVADAFGEEVAELVYWLTDSDKGNRSARAAITAWRLGRAPWDAKMIKLADIIDNGRNITEHDPDFARTFLAEKRLVMVRMVYWEGQRLQEVPLFKAALSVVQATVSRITHSA